LRFIPKELIINILNQITVNQKSEQITIMSKETKTRRAIHNYTFEDKEVDLNDYTATCTITGESKKFYHSYLANMIVTKYNNKFSDFESGYVSRSGKSLARESLKQVQIQDRINKLYATIRTLKSQVR
jgi:hypothetical protein